MVANQGSRLEQRSILEILVTEKCKPSEIYRRMCDVYREVCFSSNFRNEINMDLPL